MFGCLAVYCNGALSLLLADKEEPWHGVLVCTSTEYHTKLSKKAKGLTPHPVLGKWLYISKESPHLEKTIFKLVDIIKSGDPSIGVISVKKKSKKKT